MQASANERIAATEVVIEEIQWLVSGNSGEPEGKFGKFHSQRIQVHPIDAGFNDAPAPKADLGFFLRLAFDELRLKLRGRVIDDLVSQQCGRFDEEMA